MNGLNSINYLIISLKYYIRGFLHIPRIYAMKTFTGQMDLREDMYVSVWEVVFYDDDCAFVYSTAAAKDQHLVTINTIIPLFASFILIAVLQSNSRKTQWFSHGEVIPRVDVINQNQGKVGLCVSVIVNNSAINKFN